MGLRVPSRRVLAFLVTTLLGAGTATAQSPLAECQDYRGLRASFDATPAAGTFRVFAQRTYAQTPFVPYFGKNSIHYDRFDWHIYLTDHFEIYYYPELEQHLERIAGYAESAYQQVSSDLHH